MRAEEARADDNGKEGADVEEDKNRHKGLKKYFKKRHKHTHTHTHTQINKNNIKKQANIKQRSPTKGAVT